MEAELLKEIPNEILFEEVREQLSMGQRVIINARGWSMNPFIDGDRDSVELESVNRLKTGDVALAKLSTGNYVLHRIYAIDGDRITLMGDGNVRGLEHCTRGQVCAVAISVKRPSGRVVRLDDEKALRRARLWRRLLPLRRWLLAVYHHIILPLK